jgi:hypothetical protein
MMSPLRNRCALGFLMVVLLALPPHTSAQQSALDLDGKTVDPLKAANGKQTVLVFLRRDCPVSSRYAPTIQALALKFADTATFWLIDPDKNDSPSDIRAYLDEYKYRLPALRDPAHVLAKTARVQITPEAAVFNAAGKLIYDGRIDDWFIEVGRARLAPTTHELEDAIRATAAGKPVARNEVRGVGCYLSDLE